MALIFGDDSFQKLDEDIVLFNLAQMSGNDALLGRIRNDFGGVYAWYRRFEIDEAIINDPEKFIAYVLQELQKRHCVEREARLAPAHRITLSADSSFLKEDELKIWAKNPMFRRLLLNLLENAMLFQQPLYIGKAVNLYKRIFNHLQPDSNLRSRLADAGHNIDKCRLLLLYIPAELSKIEKAGETEESDDSEEAQLPSELLIEDILSRLFLPTFTIRYG